MPSISINGIAIDIADLGEGVNLDALAKRQKVMQTVYTPLSKQELSEQVSNADSSNAKHHDLNAPTSFKWIGNTPVPKPIPKSKDTTVKGIGDCKLVANTSTEKLVIDKEGKTHIIEKRVAKRKPRLLRKTRDGYTTNQVILQDGNTIEVPACNQEGVSRILNN